MRVYLSGGTHTNWQDHFILSLPQIDFIDPRKVKELSDEHEYTFVDTVGIKSSDIVVCYLEESNPSGMGAAFEVGYAYAKGIPVILIDEKKDRYSGMIRAAASYIYKDISDVILILKLLANRGFVK